MSHGNQSENYNIVVDVDDDEPTLEFQDFATTSRGLDHGQIGNSGVTGNNRGGEDNSTGNYSMWQVEYWAQYFNVDSSDVVQRTFLAVVPKDSFLDVYNSNPDLWGTFWIPTSAIFAIFVTSSLSQSIAQILAGHRHEYDFGMLTTAVFTVYVYILVVSTFVYLSTKYFGSQPGIMECFSVYGYGMAVWIPVSVLCVLPIDWFRWTIVAIGFASSGFFIMRSVNQIVERSNGKLHKAIIPLLFVAHALLVIVFKFRFFSYKVIAGSPSPEPEPSS